nr:hypothetical protein CFP56_62313 [Quercus suber]
MGLRESLSKKLTILEQIELKACGIEQLPSEFSNLHKLKLIDLSDSQNLCQTPTFNGLPNIERKLAESLGRILRLRVRVYVVKSRSNGSAVTESTSPLPNGCAKEQSVCTKCRCCVGRIVGRDSSEVEAKQKLLDEAIKNV